MRKILYFFLLVVIFGLCSSVVHADFKKTKIAVLDFQVQGRFDNPDMGAIVAEWFITAMVREGRFDVVERRLLAKVLKEQELAMTGAIDVNSASQIGRLLGVKTIISGSVMKLQDILEINARIIDVESGSIIAAENVRSTTATQLHDLVDAMSKKIIHNFPLEGYIVYRNNDNVTLDLGMNSGVKKGMTFMVYKEGEVIKHPKTNEILDVKQIRTGTVSIFNVGEKICEGTITEEASPGAVDYGQMVKSITATLPGEPRLFVDTSPEDARIRILNITPRYQRGMILDLGRYHVEVSAPGYETAYFWVSLDAKEEKHISISLVKSISSPAPQPAQIQAESKPYVSPALATPQSTALNATQKNYVKMLTSRSLADKKRAAKLMTRAKYSDTKVLDVAEDELLKGYPRAGTDRQMVDTMSWLCNALGASGNSKYRGTLGEVAKNSKHRKLKGYAEKNYKQLGK